MSTSTTTSTSASNGGSDDGSAYVTPLVRKLAAQHSVDLGALTGTGIGGRIRKQDVLDAAEKAKAAGRRLPPLRPSRRRLPRRRARRPAAALRRLRSPTSGARARR